MAREGFKRKLTAILSADVVGYSRLMTKDEIFTIQTLKDYLNLMTTYIERHSGRVVDAVGDNLLAEFNSAVDAVQCAVEIQKNLKNKNHELPRNKRLDFRIGINIGDVVQDGKRIFGDGVNIAARIEGLADPGGICVSRNTYAQIKNKLQLGHDYIGEHKVKNIDEPVRVYKILIESASEKLIQKKSSHEPIYGENEEFILSEEPSIAVLPFVNMSNDQEQEYFSDGITEEIISVLAKLEGMKVISRTSSFCFKGKDVDIQTIGKQLKVKDVLEGSVRKAGNRLRITAQLINVANDSHIWSETFDRELKDVFTIQEDISRAIANKFKVEPLYENSKSLVDSSTKSLESHDLYLKSLYFWNKGEHHKAIDHLERSIKYDPSNAHAYAMLANVYTYLCLYSPYPSKESYDKAKTAALKALEINNMLAEAHIAFGVIKMAYEYDWSGANESLKRSINLNPGSSMAHFYYSHYQSAIGQLDEAVTTLKRAQDLDPLSTRIRSMIGMVTIWNRQYDISIEYLNSALEEAPHDSFISANLGLAYAKKGHYEKAISILQESTKIHGNSPFLLSSLGYVFGVAGKKDEAQKIVNGFIEISNERYFSPWFISRVYAGMSDTEKALEWLEKAHEDLDPMLYLIKSVDSYQYMHSLPRFIRLLNKMGLAD